MAVSVFSPAKLNLFLAITGRRGDGFHDLVSVAAPLDLGDDLRATPAKTGFTLKCDSPSVPTDGTNLILKAAEAFAKSTGWSGGADFVLTKRIPVGAGLGGGSSNAVAALRALNELSGQALSETNLATLAATLGSDCALFLRNAPVVMRGRGERVELLPPTAAARIRGRRVLVFKPSFGISTPWAYARMVARATDYLVADQAEARLAQWLDGNTPLEELLFNNMEAAAFEKYVTLPVLLEKLRRDFGVAVRMSGSGSACFAVLPEHNDEVVTRMEHLIRAAWGPEAFVRKARLS